MAHWLFCQSCQQWSKFATPLSDDKYCPLCSKMYITVKTRIASLPDEKTVEELTVQEKPIKSETQILTNVEITESESCEISETQDKAEMFAGENFPETPIQLQKSEGAEEGAQESGEQEEQEVENDQEEQKEQEVENDQEEQKEQEEQEVQDDQEEQEVQDDQEEQEVQDDQEEQEDQELQDDQEEQEETRDAETFIDSDIMETNETPDLPGKPKMTRTPETYLERKRRKKNLR